MFEFEQEVVAELLSKDPEFKRLYEKHSELKERVRLAQNGVTPLDDFTLETLKKQKLRLKDQMAAMIARHRRAQAGPQA